MLLRSTLAVLGLSGPMPAVQASGGYYLQVTLDGGAQKLSKKFQLVR